MQSYRNVCKEQFLASLFGVILYGGQRQEYDKQHKMPALGFPAMGH